MTGLYGKLPAHGDFVRRALPHTFVLPWDGWLQASIAAAREALAEDFSAVWAAAPTWRFCLPAGACGDTAVAGILLPSRDLAGRLFPLTIAAMLPIGVVSPNDAWYKAVELAGTSARDRGDTADSLLSALQSAVGDPYSSSDANPSVGWWKADGSGWDIPMLPAVPHFVFLLQGGT